MHMSSYLLPFLDTGIDDICIYLSILTYIPYLDCEKLSMKTFFLIVHVFGLGLMKEIGTVQFFCHLVHLIKFQKDTYVLLFPVLTFGIISAVHFHHFSTHATYDT